jgi:hypothetical protein
MSRHDDLLSLRHMLDYAREAQELIRARSDLDSNPNLLSNGCAQESLMRLEGPNIAQELLKITSTRTCLLR